MKKFIACLTAICLLTTPAMAKPKHRAPKPHPAPIVLHHKHGRIKHHHKHDPFLAVFSGLVGFAVGSSLATPTVYTASAPTDHQCFVVISRSNGKLTQHCVGGDNQVLYVD